MRKWFVYYVLVGLLTASCSSPEANSHIATDEPRPEPNSENSNIIEYHTPPARVPQARAGGVLLDTLAYQWRIDGDLKQFQPESPSQLKLAEVKVSQGMGLNFEISTTIEPLMVELTTFDSPGIPTDTSVPKQYDCVKADKCKIQKQDKAFVVSLEPGLVQNTHVALLYMEFGTLEEADTQQGIGAYNATWIVKQVDK